MGGPPDRTFLENWEGKSDIKQTIIVGRSIGKSYVLNILVRNHCT